MAQIRKLEDRESGATIYPITVLSAVFDATGRDLERRFALEREVTDAALADKASAEQLAAKQDKLASSADILISGSQLNLTEQAKFALFVDMWNTAWGAYGKYDPDNAPDPQHPFMGNDIWMTYEEALLVFMTFIGASMSRPYDYYFKFDGSLARTTLPLRGSHSMDMHSAFRDAKNLEVVRFNSGSGVGTLSYAFCGCSKLKKILGPCNALSLQLTHESFSGCMDLEFAEIMHLQCNISFKDSPLLTLECIQFIINRRYGAAPITITLHPEAYARVTDELFAAAVEKNITFATT